MVKKYNFIAVLLVLILVVAGCGSANNNAGNDGDAKPVEGSSNPNASYDDVTVKIGVQGKGGLFGKAQEQKWFEDAFGELGVKVEWLEFQSGPPMIEAMASNHLDFAGMGNMPPISAQAAGIDFKIISQLLDGKNNVAIIVPNDSPIKSIADLRGKKVAVTKGSNAYNFLYQVLQKAGLDNSDIQEIQLQPDETQPSFESGKVDAWAVWDPYITLNTLSGKGKVLADGESEGVLSPSFQLVRSDFANDYPELVTLYLKTFEQARQWEANNQEEAYQRYADERNIPIDLVKGIQSRAAMINIPVSDETIASQQNTANFQFELGTIRKEINVADVFDNQYIEEALK